jgi:hypothetical protein
VEAVPEGWWYTSALPDGDRIVAFHTDSDLPAARGSSDARGFRSLLAETQCIATLVGLRSDTEFTVKRAFARNQRLPDPCGEHWCAVGDAAMAFDPVSSQGLFNALYLGVRGAQAVEGHLDGKVAALKLYGERVLRIWSAFDRNRSMTYGLERRFEEHPFWRRRMSRKGADGIEHQHWRGSVG